MLVHGNQVFDVISHSGVNTQCFVCQLTFGATRNAVLDRVDALMSAGRPGQYGGWAMADLLLGKLSPSGRLGANWPRYVSQVSIHVQCWLLMGSDSPRGSCVQP